MTAKLLTEGRDTQTLGRHAFVELFFAHLVLSCDGGLSLIHFGVIDANAIVARLLQLGFLVDQLIEGLLGQGFGVWHRTARNNLFCQTEFEILNFVVGDGFRVHNRHNVISRAHFDGALCEHVIGVPAYGQEAHAASHAKQCLFQLAKGRGEVQASLRLGCVQRERVSHKR